MTTDFMKFTNPTDKLVKLGSIGLPDVQPGGTVDVPLGVCAPTIRDNGRRGASQIEKCAPQLVPLDPAEKAAWDLVPDPLPKISLQVTTAPRAPGEPAGVVALKNAKKALAAKPVEVAPEIKP